MEIFLALFAIMFLLERDESSTGLVHIATSVVLLASVMFMICLLTYPESWESIIALMVFAGGMLAAISFTLTMGVHNRVTLSNTTPGQWELGFIVAFLYIQRLSSTTLDETLSLFPTEVDYNLFFYICGILGLALYAGQIFAKVKR